MGKIKKIIIFIIILAIIIVGAVVALNWKKIDSRTPFSEIKDNIILFYGQECPHCQELDSWIEENKVKEKISFTELEVYHNQDNQNLIIEKAKTCNISEDSIGVPFLWTGKECLLGIEPIQQFFQNLQTNETAQ